MAELPEVSRGHTRSETTEGPNVRRFWKFEVLERYAKKAENLKRGLAGKE